MDNAPALQQFLTEFKRVSNAIVDSYFIVDTERRIVDFNRAFYALLPRSIARGLKGLAPSDEPLFVGHPYEMDREVVALSGSRRTESLWIRTRVFQPGGDEVLATMLLNAAYMKDSFPDYEAESKAQATGT